MMFHHPHITVSPPYSAALPWRGRIKDSILSSWSGASPQTSKRKSLRRQYFEEATVEYLEEAKGGKLKARPAARGTQPLGSRCKSFRELPSPVDA